MLDPSAHTRLKLRRVPTAKDSAKGVVGWKAVETLQKLLEPLQMSDGKPINIGSGYGAANCAVQGQCDHVD